MRLAFRVHSFPSMRGVSFHTTIVMRASPFDDHERRVEVLRKRLSLEKQLALESVRRSVDEIEDPATLRELLVELFARYLLSKEPRTPGDR